VTATVEDDAMSAPLKIQVILGTTRQNRFGDKAAHYVLGELQKRTDVQAELVDLRDWPLPFFDHPASPMRGKITEPEVVARWTAKVGEADGYVIVTPEYNHGYPAVLKNALDWVYAEWTKKPVGFVGYGNAGGARAIEQLRQVVIELDMVPLREALHIPLEVFLAVMKETAPAPPELFKPLREGIFGDRVGRFLDALTKAAQRMRAERA
jgi:NAD(P)H-dependent FMN reductase